MTKHAYYMTQRPFSIGAQPKEGLVEVEDFDRKERVKATLVIDRGNLCFGFRTSGSTVTIHTD